jgi:DNA-binding FadR family transcriptional regulator
MDEKNAARSEGKRNLTSQQPFRIPKTAEIVADHIRSQVIRGELSDGDFLPPEAQLTATLGISRPTLREALRVLEAEHFITVVRGSRLGAQIHRPRISAVSRYAGYVLQSNQVTLADIYEARLAIEPFAVQILASKPSKEITERLATDADRMNKLIDQGRYVDFMIDTANFHGLLVELAGNRTLLYLTELVQGVLARHEVRSFEKQTWTDEELRRRALWGLRSVRKLIDLIDQGKADLAEAHWRMHVFNANRSWVPPGDEHTVIELLD